MTLVLTVQPYYFDDLMIQPELREVVIIDCDDIDQPVLSLPLIERHLKSLLSGGIINEGMFISVCLYKDQCDKDMNDTSEIVTWFSTHVANLHSETSNWW